MQGVIIINVLAVFVGIWTLIEFRRLQFVKPSFKMKNQIFTKRQKAGTALVKNFYRIYKYLYVQTCSGTRAEDILKNMYQMVSDKSLRKSLLQMAAIITQSNDVPKAIATFKKSIKHEDGEILVGILESITMTGLSKESFMRLDQMLFQKYLTQVRRDTRQIRKMYFFAVVCFVVAASGLLFFPLIDQMLKSAHIIFS